MADSDYFSDASTSSEECIESTTSTSSKQLLQQRQAALTRTYTKVQRVLPLDSFYKAVLSDLLLSRNDSFFNYLFSQIFSKKVKANIDGKQVSYEELRLHFVHLRRIYFSHASDGIIKFGPLLANSANGEREGYLAAHMVLASLADSSADDRASGLMQYNALLVTDTLEIQWVEGKDGEARRISRFDRTTRRPVRSP